ncbi:MAG: hypothetical protein IJJ14_05385 [Coriobacteriales bacterium]|nr:hypothetical protein [Coriobacteriales bacterium]
MAANNPRFDITQDEPFDPDYILAEETDGFDEHHIRRMHEDDDGYDPYSDRLVGAPDFEEDEWR